MRTKFAGVDDALRTRFTYTVDVICLMKYNLQRNLPDGLQKMIIQYYCCMF